jgi:signal transduction histidine kinase
MSHDWPHSQAGLPHGESDRMGSRGSDDVMGGLKRLLSSSTFRLTLVYMALFMISVLVLLIFIYWATTASIERQADATIEAEIKGLAERYDASGLSGLSALIVERLRRQQPGDSSIYLLADQRLEPLVGNLSGWPTRRIDESGWLDFRLGDDISGKVHMARARVFRVRGNFHLLVGRNMTELAKTRQTITHALIWGSLIMFGLALLGSVMMNRSVTRRIDTINRASMEIMNGNLARRIPSRGSGDEFDQLSENLNHMLDQIELLMDGVRRVSDNIAHDLRTPLSRLRQRLETARAGSGDEQARMELLDQALLEAEGLLNTFNALLRIARIESEALKSTFTEVDLAGLLRDVVDLYEPVAEQKRQLIEIDSEAAVPLRGDRDLLFQALANLFDNAIKYSPESCTILARLAKDRFELCDCGPGIDEAEHDKVFQRFYRTDASRSTSGSGLGLSLVKAVAGLHGMNIELKNLRPGLRVALVFDARSAT